MKILIALLFCGMALCSVNAQPIPVPAGYEVIQEAIGDLDKDSIPEKAVVFNTTDTSDDMGGIIREIIIYKQYRHEWMIWHRSRHAVLDSKSGGMMGDPFQEIEIVNGTLHITQAGGSSWKWGHTDKYRFQHNRFELIGYTGNYGKPCEYWTDVDFNIATGRIVIKKEYEKCDEQEETTVVSKRENESFTHKLKEAIHLGNRNQAEVKIVSPKYKHEIYL